MEKYFTSSKVLMPGVFFSASSSELKRKRNVCEKEKNMFTNGSKLVQQSFIEVLKEMHLPYTKETI